MIGNVICNKGVHQAFSVRKHTIETHRDRDRTNRANRNINGSYNFLVKSNLIPNCDLCIGPDQEEAETIDAEESCYPSWAENPILMSLLALAICLVGGSLPLATNMSTQFNCCGISASREWYVPQNAGSGPKTHCRDCLENQARQHGHRESVSHFPQA